MSSRSAVSPRRLRAYFGLFGVLGAWIMAGTYDQNRSFITGLRDGTTLSEVGVSVLQIGHLGQSLVCLGYLYVAWQFHNLMVERSAVPERMVKLSIAIAGTVCVCRVAFTTGWDYRAMMVLPLLLNLAFNVPLLQMFRQAADSPAANHGPAL